VPDGFKSEQKEDKKKIKPDPKKNENQDEWHIKKILKMPVTWLIFIFIIANSVVLGIMNTHQIAYLQDLGFSPMTAATTMSILAAASIAGSLTFGALAFRIDLRYLGASAFILHLVGFVILLTSRELVWLYVFSALVGMGYGALLTAFPTFIATYYGRQLYAQIMGVAVTIHSLGNAVAGAIAGEIYDAAGSYTLAFIFTVVFILIGLVSIFLTRRPKSIN
jgi:cyanate permease